MKGKTAPPWSEVAKRIATLFRRRLTTHWNEKEIAVFQKLGEMKCFETLDDLELIERYYVFERAKGDKGIHRRDLLTFLNNYGGERDRANLWADKYPKLVGDRPKSTKEQPPRWREFILKVYPQANPDFDFWRAPPDLRDEFRAWEKKQ